MEKAELTNKRKSTLGAQIADRLRKMAPGQELAILSIVVSLLYGENSRLMVDKGGEKIKSEG